MTEWGLDHPHWPFRDRKGRPITMEAASQLLSSLGLREVGQTRLGPLLISTVHLVVGHPCHGGCGAPEGWCMNALYETMIFHEDEHDGRLKEWDERQWRYHSLREAIEGHARIAAEVAALVAD